jgi:hypothetical protein
MSKEKLSMATPQLETSIALKESCLSPIKPSSSGMNMPHSSIFTDFPGNQKTSFSPEPSYKETNRYTTTITTNGDPADIYYPIANSTTCPVEFPKSTIRILPLA